MYKRQVLRRFPHCRRERRNVFYTAVESINCFPGLINVSLDTPRRLTREWPFGWVTTFPIFYSTVVTSKCGNVIGRAYVLQFVNYEAALWEFLSPCVKYKMKSVLGRGSWVVAKITGSVIFSLVG